MKSRGEKTTNILFGLLVISLIGLVGILLVSFICPQIKIPEGLLLAYIPVAYLLLIVILGKTLGKTEKITNILFVLGLILVPLLGITIASFISPQSKVPAEYLLLVCLGLAVLPSFIILGETMRWNRGEYKSRLEKTVIGLWWGVVILLVLSGVLFILEVPKEVLIISIFVVIILVAGSYWYDGLKRRFIHKE